MGAAALAIVVTGGGVAVATNGGDADERPDVAITDPAVEQAGWAATAPRRGPRRRDQGRRRGGFYGIEVTLDNGNEVAVHLDQDFTVLSDDVDSDEARDQDGQVTGLARAAAAAAFEAAGGRTVTGEATTRSASATSGRTD